MHALWKEALHIGLMPSTLGGQLTIIILTITLSGLLWRALHNLMEHLRWIELMWLEFARQNGNDVPDWLLKKHRKVNGNEKHYQEMDDCDEEKKLSLSKGAGE
jgi:hypothetical protein